jgi:hypothetical protein
MLFFPSTNETSTSGRPPIDIPVDAVALRLFVELLQQADPSPLSPDQYDGTIDALSSFMGLLDQFDCSKGIKSRALAHFQPIFEEDPWAVFCLGARYGDFMSGKEAICHFGKVHSDADKLLPDGMDPERAEALPARWLLAYVRAHIRGGNGDVSYPPSTPSQVFGATGSVRPHCADMSLTPCIANLIQGDRETRFLVHRGNEVPSLSLEMSGI